MAMDPVRPAAAGRTSTHRRPIAPTAPTGTARRGANRSRRQPSHCLQPLCCQTSTRSDPVLLDAATEPSDRAAPRRRPGSRDDVDHLIRRGQSAGLDVSGGPGPATGAHDCGGWNRAQPIRWTIRCPIRSPVCSLPRCAVTVRRARIRAASSSSVGSPRHTSMELVIAVRSRACGTADRPAFPSAGQATRSVPDACQPDR